MFNAMSRLDDATKQLFHDPDKRRAWIIFQLKLQGRSLASVGRDYGVSRGAPKHALNFPYPRMERALAEAVNVPVYVLFPDRYAPNGERLIRMGRPKKSITKTTQNNTRKKSGNAQKREAA